MRSTLAVIDISAMRPGAAASNALPRGPVRGTLLDVRGLDATNAGRKLVAPLLPIIGKHHGWIVSPDGLLASLAFEQLDVGASRAGDGRVTVRRLCRRDRF